MTDDDDEIGPGLKPMDAYSIPEFCRRHSISHGTYYNLRAKGLGPREGHILGKIIITKEAAKDWRLNLP